MVTKWGICACCTAWLLLIPALILPLLLILSLVIWRQVVDTLAKFFRPEWRPIYPPDTASLGFIIGSQLHKTNVDSRRPSCSGNIGGIGTFQEEISIEELRETFRRNLLEVEVTEKSGKGWKHWKLRVVPRQFLGFLYWAPAPAQLNLSQHIWEYCPVDEERRFEDFAIDWISNGYGDRPLWEIVISRPKLGKFAGMTAMYIKIHHSIGDAKSMRIMMEALCNVVHVPEVTKMRFTWGQTLFHVAAFPLVLYKHVCLKRYGNAPSGKSLGTIQVFRKVNLNSIKQAAKASGCSFRAIIVCTISSAIRRLMLESTQVEDLAEFIGIGVVVPALYYTRSFEFLANRATTCQFLYPLRLESPLDRLEISDGDLEENLQIGQHRTAFLSYYLMYVLPTALLEAGIMGDFPVSILASDIRCNSTPLKLFGKYLFSKETYGFMNLDSLTLASFSSVGDSVAVCLTSSNALIPNEGAAERVLDYFTQELDTLFKLSVEGPQKSISSDSKC